MDKPVPSSLLRAISPPRRPKRMKTLHNTTSNQTLLPNGSLGGIASPPRTGPTLAAVEAGLATVENHLAYFKESLAKASRISTDNTLRLSIQDFASLYEANQHEHGRHFVIHQHNHPQAGVHYDLRLQFSKTSSISFAIPKGLPGNPNSKSLGRMAIETRVHNFWNHLIESASFKTGSLLIWDTGTYTVLPRKRNDTRPSSPQTTDNGTDLEDDDAAFHVKFTRRTSGVDTRFENEKLIDAFQTRYIRLRLHGTRLPPAYTVTIRLPSTNDVCPTLHAKRPRRGRRSKSKQQSMPGFTDPESDPDGAPSTAHDGEDQDDDLDTDDEEDMDTRLKNAYPGSTNSIGSIHQRRWFLSLDRRSSGFVPSTSGNWKRDGEAGFEPFYVRGRDFERSVVTGRLAREVESDEGVEGFVGRAGWVGIMR